MNTDRSVGAIRLLALDALNVNDEFFSVNLDDLTNGVTLVVTADNLSDKSEMK